MTDDGRNFSLALALELLPAALLGFAVAFATANAFGVASAAAMPASVVAGMASALLCWAVLRRLAGEPEWPLRAFELAEFELVAEEGGELPELLLTPGQMLHRPDFGEGELLLDDVLAELDPESRVVRLFEPGAMPTAGELQERIDRHLRSGSGLVGPPDATQTLHEALADLRRSLS